MNTEHPMMTVRFNPFTGQHYLVADRAFEAGQTLCKFGAREILTVPTYLTLQVTLDKHILLTPEVLQYCNHSCQPNVFFDTMSMDFVALADIDPGDELTFFYPSTEWTMAQPFICFCGNTNCLGSIQGAASVPEDILRSYRLTDFILHQLEVRRLSEQPLVA